MAMRQSAPAFLPHFFRGSIGVGLFEIDTSNVATLSGKSGHDGRAKFAVAAGDDGYFSLKFHCLIEPAASRLLLAGRSFFS